MWLYSSRNNERAANNSQTLLLDERPHKKSTYTRSLKEKIISTDEWIRKTTSETWIKQPRSAEITLFYWLCLTFTHTVPLFFYAFFVFSPPRWHFLVSVTASFCFALAFNFFFLFCLASHAHFPLEQMIHYWWFPMIFSACFLPSFCSHFIECYLFSCNNFRVTSITLTYRLSQYIEWSVRKHCSAQQKNNGKCPKILYFFLFITVVKH